MVKSKFPGKPSKLVQRTLVSAYSVAVPSCDTSTITGNVCYGLSLFEKEFECEEDNSAFHGFDDEEIEKSFKKSRHFRYSIEEKYSYLSVAKKTSILSNEPMKEKLVESNLPIVDSKVGELCILKKKRKEQKKCGKIWYVCNKIMNRYHSKVVLRHNFKTLNKTSMIRFKHKPLASNYLTEKYCRRFNLPSRSLHSSRVIKPNKRFIDNEKNFWKNNVPFGQGSADQLCTPLDNGNTELRNDILPGKVIIREAILNISTEQAISGPFSKIKTVPFDKEKLRSGILECGVCGIIRHCKYLIQMRKFGIYSCELCRRFISKMIKRSKHADRTLKCRAENGVGNCIMLSPKEDAKDEDISILNRCEACWLNLCLHSYVLPNIFRKSLIRMLPEAMKSVYHHNHATQSSNTEYNQDFHTKINKRLGVNHAVKSSKTSVRSVEKHDVKLQSHFVKKGVRTHKENTIQKEHCLSRGPRIKHVCRSASSVLRMPSGTDDTANNQDIEPVRLFRRSSGNSDFKIEKQSGMNKIRQCSENNSVFKSSNETDIINSHRARTLQDLTKYSTDEFDRREEKLISTDFWEAYDPDEIYKVGFPLISSEPLNVRALCFLCGSAGIEKLLYCVSCCEPYHWYCAEGPSAFRERSDLEKIKVNWVCRKCKVCITCGKGSSSGDFMSCKRCRDSYHYECLKSKALNKRLFKSDHLWVCPSCLRCKSCNSSSVYTHVGNIPLCSLCFKLRQKGNYCPLCQGCYQDEDYNVPMMECGCCKCWIHAICEGISHEKYQILSFLPDSIEFVCRLCCVAPPAAWSLAVDDELKAGYYGILKSLCQNKRIGDILKESPKKENHLCSNQNSENEVNCVKRVLPFQGEDVFENCDRKVSAEDSSTTNQKDLCSSCHYDLKMRNEISQRLLEIKVNVRNNHYSSVSVFHQELEDVMFQLNGLECMEKYREVLKQFFPWFDPNQVYHENVAENSVEMVSNEIALTSVKEKSDPTENDDYARLRKLMTAEEYVYENYQLLDIRRCNLCKGMGEAVPVQGGRLIYCGRNEWVHSNCALWSSEVFEEIDGSLQNVHSAISRGRQIRCSVCDKKGATVGCCFKNCVLTYHFVCAKEAVCIFTQNKTIFCNTHDLRQINLQPLVDGKDFEILRPVYIETDRKKKKLDSHTNVRLRIGSLHVESLGKIDPHLSDNAQYILPIFYRCTRLFWSTKEPWKIIHYQIQIRVSYSCESKDGSEVNCTIDHSNDGVEQENDVRSVMQDLVERVCKSRKGFSSNIAAGSSKPIRRASSNIDDAKVGGSGSGRKSHVHILDECLRDENYFSENRRQPDFGEFTKCKRKMDFEYPTTGVKKMLDENGFLSVAKLNHTVVDCYEKIMQLDGMVDIYTDDEPVTCNQCSRTYRTTLSYERHLDTCSTDFGDFMISSCESDSMSSDEGKFSYTINNKKVLFESNPKGQMSLSSPPVVDVAFTTKYANTYIIENDEKFSMPPFANNGPDNVELNALVYPYPTITYNTNHLLNNGFTVLQDVKSVNIAPQPVIPVNEPTIKFNIVGNSSKVTNYPQSVTCQPQTFDLQTPPATYVIQHQPHPTFMTVDNRAETLITPQQVQTLYQPMVTETPVNFQPMLPILGTVMQPNVIETPVSAAFIMNTAPASLFAPQNNVIIPNQPPLLIGMETVVSNTVLSSSQQFLAQSLSGANVGSSTLYSATTTQVFQAAKQLPSQSDFSSGFIVVNAPTIPETLHVQQAQSTAVKPTLSANKRDSVLLTGSLTKAASSPIVVKPATKVNVPRKKFAKVMKVKNNRPVAIQTVNNVIPLDSVPANNTEGCMKALRIKTTNTAVLCRPEVHRANACKMYVECEPKKVRATPVPVGEVAPTRREHKPMVSKIDNRINPLTSSCLDDFNITVSKLESEVMDDFNITVPKLKPEVIDDFNITAPRLKPNKIEDSLKLAVRPTSKEESCQTDVEHELKIQMMIPELKINLMAPKMADELVEWSKKFVEVTEKTDFKCSRSMPLLDQPKSPEISDNDRIFNELLREHKLSLEKARNAKVSNSDECVEDEIRKNVSQLPIPFPEYASMEKTGVRTFEPSTRNVVLHRTKYRPRILDRKEDKPPETPRVKNNAVNSKKNTNTEKENVDKQTYVKKEKKSWKTASISFEVNTEDGFTYKTNNLADLWNKILESVQQSRAKHKLPLLPQHALIDGQSVYSLLGLESNASKYLLEQLPDAWKCIFYKPVFHKSPQYGKSSVVENVSGCARTEPFTSSHRYDMFGWLASRHRKPPKFMTISDSDIVNGNRRVASVNLPMAMRFRHLKETAKETVGVFRSDIHGRGLFCLRDIDSGEMVIEYAGEVIRSTLTDKREKYYTSKGIGCYMFRIDDKYVVDATMCGNAARFINHSCDPNCYSRIVDILGKKHIIIFALRRIPKGEELTYDYKFPLEEDKIYCHCLARKCRKYLN